MREYVIMTDSSCDLPSWKLEEIGVEVVPLTVDVDGKTYVNYPDWRDIEPHAFFEVLRGGAPAKTSAPAVGVFKSAMSAVLDTGKDLFYIGFTSSLSGTYNAGRLAVEQLSKEYPDRHIISIDSLCASLGQGLYVSLVAQKKAEGATIEEAFDFANSLKLKICHWFTVDDLHFLKRGGRVSATTAIIGTTLGIKPVMHMDAEGRLTKFEIARGRKASVRKLADKLREGCEEFDTAYIVHGDCEDDARRLEEMVKEDGIKTVLINSLGPVIGAHSGPGTLALFYVGNNR